MNNQILPYKNRVIDSSIPVFVYKNLTLSKPGELVYSIKQNNKVVAHATYLELRNIKFVISKSGQELTRKNRKKYVHAFVRGEVVENINWSEEKVYRIHYNPFKSSTFLAGDLNEPVYKAYKIYLGPDGVYASDPY